MKFRIYIVLSLLGVSITMSPMGQGKKTEDYLTQAPPIIRDFVHEHVKAIGLNPSKIAVTTGTTKIENGMKIIRDVDWASNPKTINVPYYETSGEHPSNLCDLLQKQKQGHTLTAQEKEHINLCAGTAQHEGTHIKNNDNKNKGRAALSVLGATTLPLFYAWRKSRMPISAKNLLGMLSLPVVLGVNVLASHAICRYHERKADDGIVDDIDILQAKAHHFRKAAEQDKQDELAHQRWFPHESPFKRKMSNVFEYLLSTHPSNEQRAQRFEQRLAKLKEK